MCELPLWKVTAGPGHTAHAKRGHRLGPKALAQYQLGGAAANVHDQPLLVGLGQQAGHALVDQARFLRAGYHIDGVAQQLTAPVQENIAVARFAQRLGGHRTHPRAGEIGEPLGKTCQAVPATLHGFEAEVVLTVQAVALAHGLLEVVHALDASMLVEPDFQAKAVRPQVDSGKKGSVLHCWNEKVVRQGPPWRACGVRVCRWFLTTS